MKRIKEQFMQGKQIIPYITGGDPDLDVTARLLESLSAAGAGIIEIGIPYSDPLADGPVIQAAGQRALENGTGLVDILDMVSEVSNRVKAPLILMGYYNSIYRYGRKAFVKDCKGAGVSGVIIPDLPFEEDPEFYRELKKAGIAGILLVAPNTPVKRIEEIASNSSGFLYCVSLLGVTGDARGPFQQIEEYTDLIREKSQLPLGLGFGIDGPQKARKVSQYVDGIIIGSALIEIIHKYRNNVDKMLAETGEFITEIKANIL